MAVSISFTAAILYGGCCVMFLVVVVFLFFCKIAIIDADPDERVTPVRWIGRKKQNMVMC